MRVPGALSDSPRSPCFPPPPRWAGNLLVLSDGRVGFIDFGIVGRISPGTWGAMQALVTSASTNDYRLMAKALIQMGATAPVEEARAGGRGGGRRAGAVRDACSGGRRSGVQASQSSLSPSSLR